MNCSKGSENAQIACSLNREMMVGAASGAKFGVHGAAVGAGAAAVQNVAFRLMDHGPVNVRMPNIPMNPSHLGNHGNNNGAMPNFSDGTVMDRA